MGNVENTEEGVVTDLFLYYCSVEGWEEIVNLYDKMSKPLTSTMMIQEQYVFALNRNGEGEEAGNVLLNLLENRGGSSETYGILGRVYKERWQQAEKSGRKFLLNPY